MEVGPHVPLGVQPNSRSRQQPPRVRSPAPIPPHAAQTQALHDLPNHQQQAGKSVSPLHAGETEQRATLRQQGECVQSMAGRGGREGGRATGAQSCWHGNGLAWHST